MAILNLCRCGAVCDPGKDRCPKHQRKDTRPSAHARGYDARHEADRRRQLKDHPFCEECDEPATVLDHRDGLGPNGPFGHDPANHRSYCEPCHNRRTARDQPAGTVNRQPYRSHPFVVLCGLSGVGKSTIRDKLAQALDAQSLGRDDFETWTDLLDALDQHDRAVVECVRIHSALRRRVRERRAIIVELTAPTYVLRDRLSHRGETDATINQRLSEVDAPIGYEDDLTADLLLNTGTADLDVLVAEIAGYVQDRWAEGAA